MGAKKSDVCKFWIGESTFELFLNLKVFMKLFDGSCVVIKQNFNSYYPKLMVIVFFF